ncbi:hypothetical protein DL768_005737 [Monosporascus sp. mg162]|nr:hypothetical protein DL768_005737 [Monosporascus sp. mg162]
MLLQFAEKYSKVVEAVATAGGPYSTVAYETLSVLVFQNKVDNDNKVVSLLDEIRKCLPRLENWESIYPTETMRRLVVTTYLRITEFSKKAAEYFTHFRKRLKLALFPSFVTGFDEIGADIRTTLAEINDEAMYGLHREVNSSGKRQEYLKERADKAELAHQKLLAQNGELLAQNESLKAVLEKQRLKFEHRDKQETERRLRAFSDFLEVRMDYPGTEVATTKETLMVAFPDLPSNPRLVPCTGYTQASRHLLYTSHEYIRWHQSKESCLLFISGCTEWYGRHETGFLHCWLSPFAIYIAEDASQMDKTRVAFFSCLPQEQPEPVNISMVFASLILQVIHWQPELLREHDDQFRRILQRKDKTWSVESLAHLLGRVLSQLNSEAFRTVYIVIDRLDCCLSDNLSQVMMYLSSMITELKDSPVSVKLLVIAETSEGNAEWHNEWLPGFKFDLGRLIVRHDWDQQQRLSWRSATDSRPRIWSSASMLSVTTF